MSIALRLARIGSLVNSGEYFGCYVPFGLSESASGHWTPHWSQLVHLASINFSRPFRCLHYADHDHHERVGTRQHVRRSWHGEYTPSAHRPPMLPLFVARRLSSRSSTQILSTEPDSWSMINVLRFWHRSILFPTICMNQKASLKI